MLLTKNKKAYHEYQILEIIEAGLILSGPEVKSAKTGQIDFKGSYITISPSQEAWLENTYIAPYKPARREQTHYQPLQQRKLLLKAKQLRYLVGKQKEPGISIVPLATLNKNRLIKLEIGIVRGKKKHDKRESIKKREFDRKKKTLF